MHQPLRAAAALWAGVGRGGADVAFSLEAIERGVERTDADLTVGPGLDFVPDRYAIGALAEMGDGEQNRLLELPQRFRTLHAANICCTAGVMSMRAFGYRLSAISNQPSAISSFRLSAFGSGLRLLLSARFNPRSYRATVDKLPP